MNESWAFPVMFFCMCLVAFVAWVADARLKKLDARIDAIEARFPKPGLAP